MSIFIDEVTRKLTAEGYKVSEENGVLTTNLSNGEEAKFSEKKVYNGWISLKGMKECGRLEHMVSDIRTFCIDYESASPLAKAEDGYRNILEYDGIILAMRYDKKRGFLFSTFNRTYDGKSVFDQRDLTDYEQAKEDFASQAALFDSDRYFDFPELENLRYCVDFVMSIDKSLDSTQREALEGIYEKIPINIPEPQNNEPKMTM